MRLLLTESDQFEDESFFSNFVNYFYFIHTSIIADVLYFAYLYDQTDASVAPCKQGSAASDIPNSLQQWKSGRIHFQLSITSQPFSLFQRHILTPLAQALTSNPHSTSAIVKDVMAF